LREATKDTWLAGDTLYLVIGTICLMSVLTVIKICHDKKQMKIYLEQKRLEELEQKRREEMGSEDEEPV
jgi:hypothetical protein